MIHGSVVTLRPAREQDRRAVYQWMAESEVTASMMGPPRFPDAPTPTWDQFCNDYVDYFFDGARPEAGRSYIIEVDGEAVGHVSSSEADLTKRRAELDIWLRSEAVCGRGYGSDALRALMNHLHQTLGLSEFIIRPSLRNERAIRSYAKAGFTLPPLTTAQQTALYGPGDHVDTIVMRYIAPALAGEADQGSDVPPAKAGAM